MPHWSWTLLTLVSLDARGMRKEVLLVASLPIIAAQIMTPRFIIDTIAALPAE
jgi:hypothetical protein